MKIHKQEVGRYILYEIETEPNSEFEEDLYELVDRWNDKTEEDESIKEE